MSWRCCVPEPRFGFSWRGSDRGHKRSQDLLFPRKARLRVSPSQRLVTACFAALAVAVTTAVVATAAPESSSGSDSVGISAEAATDVLASRSDAASAQLKARTSQTRVEVMGARTESVQTFANPDGSFTTEMADGPVRVKQDDGSWKDLDLDLVVGRTV